MRHPAAALIVPCTVLLDTKVATTSKVPLSSNVFFCLGSSQAPTSTSPSQTESAYRRPGHRPEYPSMCARCKVFNSPPLKGVARCLRGLARLKPLGSITQLSIEQIKSVVSANSFIFRLLIKHSAIFSPESDAPHRHPAVQSATSFITCTVARRSS